MQGQGTEKSCALLGGKWRLEIETDAVWFTVLSTDCSQKSPTKMVSSVALSLAAEEKGDILFIDILFFWFICTEIRWAVKLIWTFIFRLTFHNVLVTGHCPRPGDEVKTCQCQCYCSKSFDSVKCEQKGEKSWPISRSAFTDPNGYGQ